MRIEEVAKKFNLEKATLRYYEQEGIITNVPRRNGIRYYSDENIRVIEFVTCMRGAGMSIERLKKYMKLIEIPNTEKERLEILIEQKEEVEEKILSLQSSLEKLNLKIDIYQKGE